MSLSTNNLFHHLQHHHKVQYEECVKLHAATHLVFFVLFKNLYFTYCPAIIFIIIDACLAVTCHFVDSEDQLCTTSLGDQQFPKAHTIASMIR